MPKIRLDEIRVLIGRRTGNIYAAWGDLVEEEINDTVIDVSPNYKVGHHVRISPDAIHGYIGMTGTVEDIFIGVNPDSDNAYGVRVNGIYALFQESKLKPA